MEPMTAASAVASEPMLRSRWLGRVTYRDAWALQQALFAHSGDDHLLMLEHPPVYTRGRSADIDNILPAAAQAAEIIDVDRGGDVTFHGPGQLVVYPIRSIEGKRGGGMADTSAYVADVEQLIIDALADLGLPGATRLNGFPGVWLEAQGSRPRKIAAIGVRLSRGRTMHGFALNVSTDLAWFDNIVPCGLTDKSVTSLVAEGIDVDMKAVVDVVSRLAAERWAPDGGSERQDVVWRHRSTDLSVFSRRAGGENLGEGTSVRLTSRLNEAGVTEGLEIRSRKPEWLRVKAEMGAEYRELKKTINDLDLVTVCEEAGCPNIYECWSDGTATFMINGDRCTRACGFCLVDTRKPNPVDEHEPQRIATAVAQMKLTYAVLTTVARDDLADGGASGFVATINAIRERTPGVGVEVLISDCEGIESSLDAIFSARPAVLNHNVETVARLQRAVRPSASYARSLSVLARAKAQGLTTKSSLMVGIGETYDEMVATLADLAAIGTDIVTIGQYLRPTSEHLPISRWWTPDEFEKLASVGRQLGIGHVESSPLTRSSYHARQAADATR